MLDGSGDEDRITRGKCLGSEFNVNSIVTSKKVLLQLSCCNDVIMIVIIIRHRLITVEEEEEEFIFHITAYCIRKLGCSPKILTPDCAI